MYAKWHFWCEYLVLFYESWFELALTFRLTFNGTACTLLNVSPKLLTLVNHPEYEITMVNNIPLVLCSYQNTFISVIPSQYFSILSPCILLKTFIYLYRGILCWQQSHVDTSSPRTGRSVTGFPVLPALLVTTQPFQVVSEFGTACYIQPKVYRWICVESLIGDVINEHKCSKCSGITVYGYKRVDNICGVLRHSENDEYKCHAQ